MRISSYLIHPVEGQGAGLMGDLSRIKGMNAEISDDGSLILLVTESETERDEEAMQARLDHLPKIRSRVLTFVAGE